MTDKPSKDARKKATSTHRYVTDIYGHTYALPHSVNLTNCKSITIHPSAKILVHEVENQNQNQNQSQSQSQSQKPGIVNFYGVCVLGPNTTIRITPNNCITISNCSLNNIDIELSAPGENYLTLDNVNCAASNPNQGQNQNQDPNTDSRHKLIFNLPTDCPAPNRFNAKLENLKLCHRCHFKNIHWIQGLPSTKSKVKKTTAKPKTHPKTNRALTHKQTKLPTIELIEKKMPAAPLELFNCHFDGPITLRTQHRLQNIYLALIPSPLMPHERITPLHLTFNHDQLKANTVNTEDPNSTASALHQKHLTPDPNAEITSADLERIKEQRSKKETVEKEIAEQPTIRRFGYTDKNKPQNPLIPANTLPASIVDEISSLLGKTDS